MRCSITARKKGLTEKAEKVERKEKIEKKEKYNTEINPCKRYAEFHKSALSGSVCFS